MNKSCSHPPISNPTFPVLYSQQAANIQLHFDELVEQNCLLLERLLTNLCRMTQFHGRTVLLCPLHSLALRTARLGWFEGQIQHNKQQQSQAC
jgi:hypothetical protein